MKKIEQWLSFSNEFNALFPDMFGKKMQIRAVDQDLVVQDFQDLQSDIPVTFAIGQKLPPKSGPSLALAEMKVNQRLVDRSHYGVELRTVNIPLQDESGCISLIYNVKMQHDTFLALENIVSSSQEITASSEEISRKAIQMNNQFADVAARMSESFQHSLKMKDIYQIVKETNNQLNLISINALIEAAHAGEHGRGFTVVAKEVRKLADSTKEQIDQINESVEQLTLHMQSMTQMVTNMKIDTEQQSGSSMEIHQAIESVTNSINDLHEAFGALYGNSIAQ